MATPVKGHRLCGRHLLSYWGKIQYSGIATGIPSRAWMEIAVEQGRRKAAC